MPLALRQRKPQAIIQKEGRCEEDQPSRAQRKLRVHRKGIRKHYAAQEHRATITPPTPPHHRAPPWRNNCGHVAIRVWVALLAFAAGSALRVGTLSIERFDY